MPEFATTAELDIRVEYEDGPDGPEMGRIFIGEITPLLRRYLDKELKAMVAKQVADSKLEHQLSRRGGQ